MQTFAKSHVLLIWSHQSHTTCTDNRINYIFQTRQNYIANYKKKKKKKRLITLIVAHLIHVVVSHVYIWLSFYSVVVVPSHSTSMVPSLMFFPHTNGNWTTFSRMSVTGFMAGKQARKGSMRMYSHATSPDTYLANLDNESQLI